MPLWRSCRQLCCPDSRGQVQLPRRGFQALPLQTLTPCAAYLNDTPTLPPATAGHLPGLGTLAAPACSLAACLPSPQPNTVQVVLGVMTPPFRVPFPSVPTGVPRVWDPQAGCLSRALSSSRCLTPSADLLPRSTHSEGSCRSRNVFLSSLLGSFSWSVYLIGIRQINRKERELHIDMRGSKRQAVEAQVHPQLTTPSPHSIVTPGESVSLDRVLYLNLGS